MIDINMVLLKYDTPEHKAWLKDNSCNGIFIQKGEKWVGPYVPAEKAEKYKLTSSDLYKQNDVK